MRPRCRQDLEADAAQGGMAARSPGAIRMKLSAFLLAFATASAAAGPAFAQQSQEIEDEMHWITARCLLSVVVEEDGLVDTLARASLRQQVPDVSALDDAVAYAHEICDEDYGWTPAQHDLADRILVPQAIERYAEQRLAEVTFTELNLLTAKMDELGADRVKVISGGMRDPVFAERVNALIKAAGVPVTHVEFALKRLEAQLVLEQLRPQWLALKPE